MTISRRVVRRFDEITGAMLSESTSADTRVETLDAGCYGPDGNIYAAGNSMGSGSILRFDGKTGKYLNFFLEMSRTPITCPVSMRFGPDGDLYVAWIPFMSSTPPPGNGIFRFDGATGAPKGDFVSPNAGLGIGEFIFGPDGNVYAQTSDSIIKLRAGTGENLGTFISTSAAGWMYGSRTFTFGPDGDFYWLNGDLKRFNGHTGAFISTVIRAQDSGLDRPSQLLFGPDGDIYIGEADTLAIKRFDGKTYEAKGIAYTSAQDSYKTYTLTGMGFSCPRLKITPGATSTVLAWPQTLGKYVVEVRNSFDPAAAWNVLDTTPAVVGAELILETPHREGQTFFRLRKQ